MRHLEPSKEAFQVKIEPGVWSLLGAIRSSTFRQIQSELEGIAALAGISGGEGRARPRNLSFAVEDYVAIYSVDSARKQVVLHQIVPSHRG